MEYIKYAIIKGQRSQVVQDMFLRIPTKHSKYAYIGTTHYDSRETCTRAGMNSAERSSPNYVINNSFQTLTDSPRYTGI